LSGSFLLLELSFKHLYPLLHPLQLFQQWIVRVTLCCKGAAGTYD